MYKTGDFGFIKDGLIYYEGRRDTQIKVRGNRIDITEVENNLIELDYVSKSAILVYHAQQLDQALVAFITTNDSEKTPKDVELDLRAKIEEFMIPQIIIIDDFPYLPNDKVDRQALLKMFAKIASKYEKQMIDLSLQNIPHDKLHIAKPVFEIIGESLGSELRGRISINSNFFQNLGGNSMNVVYTVTELRSKGFFIGIADFLKAENLGEILDLITRNSSATDYGITIDKTLVWEPLDFKQKDECIRLIGECFIKKGDLDSLLPNLELDHYFEVCNFQWDKAVKNGLSFMVKSEHGKLLGVSLNYDVFEMPDINFPDNPLQSTIDLLKFIEEPIM